MATFTQTIQPFLSLVENNKFSDLDIQQFFTVVSSAARNNLPNNELNDAAVALMNAIVKDFNLEAGLEVIQVFNVLGMMIELGADANLIYKDFARIVSMLAIGLPNFFKNPRLRQYGEMAAGMLCPPCQAVFGNSASARSLIRQDANVLQAADEFRWKSSPSKMLHMLLNVLDDEQLIVIDVTTNKGFTVKIGGIADNDQLLGLLADRLITKRQSLTGNAPPVKGVKTYEGFGEQMSSTKYESSWFMYNWTVVEADGSINTTVQKSSGQRIWGEGVPSDIAKFKGTRVILLTPAEYIRSTDIVRIFGPLKATLEVTGELDSDAVKKMIKEMSVSEDREERSKWVEFKSGKGIEQEEEDACCANHENEDCCDDHEHDHHHDHDHDHEHHHDHNHDHHHNHDHDHHDHNHHHANEHSCDSCDE